MAMGIYYSCKLKRVVQQISKPKAKKLWEHGVTIYLHPSKMMLDNPWQSPMGASKTTSSAESFDGLCNSYMYYNCDSYRGKYIRFFVEVKQ